MIRKSVTLLLGAALCLALSAQAFGQTSVELPYKKIDVTGVNGAASFQGAACYGTPGRPELPVYTITFLVPESTDLSKVSVGFNGLVETELSGTWSVKPALPPTVKGEIAWPKGLNVVDGKDPSVYGKNAFFPESCKGPVVTGKMRQYKLVEVTVYPVRYNPVTGKILMIAGGQISLSGIPFVSANSVSPANSDSAVSGGNVINRLKAIIVNDADVTGYAQTQAASLAATTVSGTYAIITTSAIANASTQLANFISHKKALGFNVMLATESAWGGGTGNTASDRIREWLKANYLTQNMSYALLIGNPTPETGDVPMKMCWPRYTSDSYRESPSDFYYAELTGNWDANGNGIYGEDMDCTAYTAGGADKYAEIAVGRIPYYGNVADLDKILAKTIAYETSSQTAWRKNVLLPMEPSDASTPGFQLGEAIKRDSATPAGFAAHRIYDEYNGYSGYAIDGVLALNPPVETKPCNEQNVTADWTAKPYGVTVWWTHGWSEGASDIMTSSSALTLNDAYPSFTFQVSCNNAEPEIATNLAYTLLKNGAIATVAATRVSWYWIGESEFFAASPSSSNAGMSHSYSKYLIADGLACGDALNSVKSGVEPYGMWMNWLDFNVYGDPSVSLGSANAVEKKVVLAVNCGGTAYTAKDGTVYQADANFTGGETAATTSAIAGTEDDFLYQSERWGTSSYAVAGLANGTYEIKFQLAETYWNAGGRRVFDVLAENQTIIANLDIYALVGANTAYQITKQVSVNDGTLDISFANAAADQPKISSFVVYSLAQTVNQAPIAAAGGDVSTLRNTTVTLDGSGSYDPDNGPQVLSFYWTQVSGPTTVIIQTPAQKALSVYVDGIGSYEFELAVYDGKDTARDRVIINVPNQSPVPNAGPDQTVDVNTPVILDAGKSYDPDMGPVNPMSYTWSQSSGPAWVTMSNVSVTTGFTPTVAGTYVFLLTVSDGIAKRNDEVIVTVRDTTAYIVLPGRIQAEDYKAGGEGIGYHDLTSGNTGGIYKTDGVDIEATSDTGAGYNVGWIDTSEWLAYNVKVSAAGTYRLEARVASAAAGTKQISILIDGVNVTPSFTFTANSGWQTWSTVVSNNVALTAGTHELKIVMTAGGFNLNYLDVTAVAEPVVNLVKNGDFASGATNWTAFTQTPNASATHTLANGIYKVQVATAGTEVWHVSLSQIGIALVNGKKYTLSFTAKAASGTTSMEAFLQKEGGDWATYSPILKPAITTGSQGFSMDFTMTAASDANARLQLAFGKQTVNTIEIDNVSVKEVE